MTYNLLYQNTKFFKTTDFLREAHIWFEGEDQIAVLQDDRPLPKRLKLDESWETRIECHRIPDWAQDKAYTMFRA
ncbi:MAG: hypothetical protein ACRENG_30695, partial [bacterium]